MRDLSILKFAVSIFLLAFFSFVAVSAILRVRKK